VELFAGRALVKRAKQLAETITVGGNYYWPGQICAKVLLLTFRL
jgi:hypothetical protein